MISSDGSQHMHHGVLYQTLGLQRQHHIENLPRQAEGHQLWHREELQCKVQNALVLDYKMNASMWKFNATPN